MHTLIGTRNEQFNWNKFGPQYYEQYLGKVIWEDRCLGRFTIGALLELGDESGIKLESLQTGIDACNGGVVRGPSLIAPFMRDAAESVIYWSDYGKPQVQNAQEVINAGKKGNLGGWAAHQTHLGKCRPEWSGGSLKACKIGEVVEQSIFDLPKKAYDIGITCFGPESLTGNEQEWEQASLTFFQSIARNGLVAMLYMRDKKQNPGWGSAGERYPAVAIREEDVFRVAKYELSSIQTFSVTASNEARPDGDEFGYEGMGAIVGRRK
ncbi:MAG: hypothetical protein ACREGJ_00875 [Candidatus Saccharimonadales bacterium]